MSRLSRSVRLSFCVRDHREHPLRLSVVALGDPDECHVIDLSNPDQALVSSVANVATELFALRLLALSLGFTFGHVRPIEFLAHPFQVDRSHHRAISTE